MLAFCRLSQEDLAWRPAWATHKTISENKIQIPPKWPANNVYEYHLNSYTNPYHYFILILGMFSDVFLDH